MILEDIKACQGSGILPLEEVVPVNGSGYECVFIDDYDGHPLKPNEVLTCSAPEYLMKVQSTNSMFSFNSAREVGTHNTKANTFVISFFKENSSGDTIVDPRFMRGLGSLQNEYYNKNSTGDYRQISPNKEEKFMPDQVINPMELLNQKVAESRPKEEPAVAAQPTAPKQTRSQKREQQESDRSQFEGRIKHMTSNVTSVISDDITAFNRKHGRLLGYITGNDAKVSFSVSKVKPKTDAAASTQATASEFTITVRQAKPSKPKGVIFTIPENTYRSIDELIEHREDYTVSKLSSQIPTMITLMESAEVAHRIISLYFKGEILESEELWAGAGHGGEQGRVECGYKQRSTRKGSSVAEMHSYMKALRESGITSQLVDWNYLPLKVYEEISVGSEALPAEQMRLLVDTVYRPLQSTGGKKGSKDDATTKFNRLSPTAASYFHTNPDGSVSVDFFQRDTAAYAMLMAVKKFWSPRTADYLVAENGRIPIAFKRDVKAASEDKPPRFQYATISVLDDDGAVIFDKFKYFVGAVGEGILNQETLKPFARRTATKKAESGIIRGAVAQKLALGELNETLIKTNGISLNAVSNLSDAIEASRERARMNLMEQITR